jgi:hypothetical protein
MAGKDCDGGHLVNRGYEGAGTNICRESFEAFLKANRLSSLVGPRWNDGLQADVPVRLDQGCMV